MTRYSIAIDSAGQQGNPTYSDSLGFVADTLTVVNPTVSTVYILSGGSTVPTSYANATDSVPPLSVRSLPVNSATFAVGFGAPTYPVTQPSPVTVATLLFTAGEPTPQYGAIPPSAFQLSGTINVSITNANIDVNITNSVIDVAAPQETLVTQQAKVGDAAVGATIPVGTRAIGVTGWSNLPATASMQVTGNTSGTIYWFGSKGDAPSRAGDMIVFPFLGSLDAAIQILVSGTGGASYTIGVYAFAIWPGTTADARAIPYVHAVSSGAPPDDAVFGFVVAPAAFTTIATTAALTGQYRVRAYAFSDDTPALSKRLVLVVGALQFWAPVGARVEWDIPCSPVLAASAIFVENAGAGGAGAAYGATILAYRIP